MEEENGKEKQKKKEREREREGGKAVQPESEENHFSTAVISQSIDFRMCCIVKQEERNNMLNVFMLEKKMKIFTA